MSATIYIGNFSKNSHAWPEKVASTTIGLIFRDRELAEEIGEALARVGCVLVESTEHWDNAWFCEFQLPPGRAGIEARREMMRLSDGPVPNSSRFGPGTKEGRARREML